MDSTSMAKKPDLPLEWYSSSPLWSSVFVLYAILMYVGGGLGAFGIVCSPWSWWSKAPLVLAALFLAQQGLHLLAWVGHDGFHFSLHKNNVVSCVLGIFFSSMIGSFLQIGASISHWNHHLYTNLEQDPDIPIFTRFKSAFMRVLCARTYANGIYRRNTLRILRGEPLLYASSLPFPPHVVRRLAWLNVGCASAWLVVYALVLWRDPRLGFVAIVLPHVAASFYTGIRSYLEHADTRVGDFVNARTRTSPLLTALYFGNNYHLEHHLYPSVACYRLPAVHALLVGSGHYDRPGVRIDRTLWDAYKHAGTRYSYPSAPARAATDSMPVGLMPAVFGTAERAP